MLASKGNEKMPAVRPAVLAVALVAVMVAPASAQNDTSAVSVPQQVELEDNAARQLFLVAATHYSQGRFVDAAREYEEAYRLSPRPGLLYNAYLAHRDANQRPDAARTLRAYLDAEPAPEDRPMLEARLEALEREVRETQSAQTATAAGTPPPDQTQTAGHTGHAGQPRPSPAQRSIIAPVVLLSAGGALLVGAAITGVVVLGQHADLTDQCPGGVCDPSLRSDVDSLDTLALVTDVLALAGIVSAAIGVTLLLVVGGSDTERASAAPAASAACSPHGCGLTLRWRL